MYVILQDKFRLELSSDNSFLYRMAYPVLTLLRALVEPRHNYSSWKAQCPTNPILPRWDSSPIPCNWIRANNKYARDKTSWHLASYSCIKAMISLRVIWEYSWWIPHVIFACCVGSVCKLIFFFFFLCIATFICDKLKYYLWSLLECNDRMSFSLFVLFILSSCDDNL